MGSFFLMINSEFTQSVFKITRIHIQLTISERIILVCPSLWPMKHDPSSLHMSHSASSIILTTSAGNLYYQYKSRKQLFFPMKTSSHSAPYTWSALSANSQAEDIKISKSFEGNALKNKSTFWVCHSLDHFWCI